MTIYYSCTNYVIKKFFHWRASKPSETLSGVYKFEICNTYKYTCIYLYMYVYMDVHEA